MPSTLTNKSLERDCSTEMGVGMPVPNAMGTGMQNARTCNIHYLFFVIFTSLHIRYLYNHSFYKLHVLFYVVDFGYNIKSCIPLRLIYIYTSFFKILIVFLTYAYPVAIYKIQFNTPKSTFPYSSR